MTITQRRRKILSITLAALVLVLFAALATLNAFHLGFLNPATTPEIFAYTALSAVAFLLFVAVLVLLVRNVLKLYADQRTRLLGARLRTRMVWGAVLVSLVPIVFMFAFSYLLMNRAVDRWFSQPVTQMRDDSNRIALQLAQYTAANARVEAEAIAAEIPQPSPAPTRSTAPAQRPASGHRPATHRPASKDPARKLPERPAPVVSQRDLLTHVLSRHEVTLQNGFAVIYRESHAIAGFQLPAPGNTPAQLKTWIPDSADDSTEAHPVPATASPASQPIRPQSLDAAILNAAQRNDQPIFSAGDMDFALGTAAMKGGGTVVVGLPVPFGMSATMTRLHSAADAYWTLFRSRRQIRNLYTWLLIMITALALFACCWLALHLAKQVTRPVESLADAMDLIAAGDYAHRLEASATDELSDLARSFNRMAADLDSSRRAVLESTVQISAANAALEARRSELETMLETIPNGVATLSPDRRIVLANRALSEMMDPGGQRSFLGSVIDAVLPTEVNEVLDRLIGRSHRMGSASSELELTVNGTLSNLLATVALLETQTERGREHHGYVVVLENATDLLRAQKQSAWKEVARRVAHEIKNPLTPIALSAEQTRRHIDRLADTLAGHGLDSPSIAIIRRCTEITSSSVDSMRSLVDQFSALAEFPTAQPRPADLNTIVENALALFAGRLQKIRIVRSFAPGLPLVLADPEALKRALSNLIDNAAEAMQHALLRELRISTALADTGLIELTLADTGSGLTDEMRERLFLPYFSTKQRGTGLGLAIAAKIIQEHGGTIRAEKNEPAGALFLVELRPAPIPTDLDPVSPESVSQASL
jgi:two-component system nitrogen regulation sensor histidine kinase NtrY